MRKLRIVIGAVGGAPAILASVLGLDACGGQVPLCDLDASATDAGLEASGDGPILTQDSGSDAGSGDTGTPPVVCTMGPPETHIVNVPSPGVPADQGQLCSVTPPAKSNTSARLSLTQYSPQTEMAKGFVAVPPTIESLVFGLSITVVSSSNAQLSLLTTSNVQKTKGGFTFDASWPQPIPKSPQGEQMVVKISLWISCADGGTSMLEAQHEVDMCVDGNTYAWVSAGDACTVCAIIAEMAPSPIVSDNQGDDLPLARHLRLRVVELARAGRQVLLFAENDGGERAEYEWRVSGGAVERVAPDIVLWTLPDAGESDLKHAPFGQVAVWSDEGAAVENFLWAERSAA